MEHVAGRWLLGIGDWGSGMSHRDVFIAPRPLREQRLGTWAWGSGIRKEMPAPSSNFDYGKLARGKRIESWRHRDTQKRPYTPVCG